MKILLTSHNLTNPGGSKTFVWTLARHYKHRGHDVHVVTAETAMGKMALALTSVCPVLFGPDGAYDVGIISQPWLFRGATIDACHRTVGVLHSMPYMGENELPDLGAWAAISEEVKLLAPVDSEIVLNPIDLDYFKAADPPRYSVRSVLHISQYQDIEWLEPFCSRRGLEFRRFRALWPARPEMEAADLIVGYGRTVYEAMALGREAVILDSRHYQQDYADGLASEVYQDAVRCNCSGRWNKEIWGPKQMGWALERYDRDRALDNRRKIAAHHDVKVIGEQLLRLAG